MMVHRPRSLAVQLGLFFAVASIVTFSSVGMYLYQSLSAQLQARDDLELTGTVNLMRHLLTESPSFLSVQNNPHRFLDAIAGHDGLRLMMQSSSGAVLVKSFSGRADIAALPVVPLDTLPQGDFVRERLLASGVPTRAIAAWGEVGGDNIQVSIMVARTASARMNLLADYRSDVLIAVIVGSLATALSGFLLGRRGLRQVRTIARQAHNVTAQQLDTRLDAATAPQELQDLVHSFNAMLDRLQGSFQRLSQFSADLAHDLRTPLNNLMVQTEVALARPRAGDEYETLLLSNHEEYQRLTRMVESMLFLARADNAKVALHLQSLDAAAELNRIADYFEGIATDAGVAIIVEATGTIVADAMLFRRAVNNLVANAIRYTPHGQNLRLQSSPSALGCDVIVSNPGAGIRTEQIARLFDRFYRTDQSRTDSSSSTGLGLAIVQSIMTLHGGSAKVDSTIGGMTHFTLTFPLTQRALSE